MLGRNEFVGSIAALLAGAGLLGAGCGDNLKPQPEVLTDHGPIAEGISAKLGRPWPSATPEQLATFERGIKAMQKRFTRAEGLGPAFNVTFCGACHEKPTFGGGAGQYRNFFIAGQSLEDKVFLANKVPGFLCGQPLDGSYVPPEVRVTLPKDQYDPPYESREGAVDGVVRMYFYGDDNTSRPAPYSPNPETDEALNFNPPPINVVAQRNPIPFFGAGLIAEIPRDQILVRHDPDDLDGDGISGRAHFLSDDIGRFGLKAQTSSVEGFIRGPFYNHLGITSDPLTYSQRLRLPINSAGPADTESAQLLHGAAMSKYAQAVAPTGPNCDIDDVLDPELDGEVLFDIVSASMLMAAPLFEAETAQSKRGRQLFDEARCGACHAPRLSGPKGPIPVYSDLLLHDMGPALDDGLTFGEAKTFEFRTQPLWGIAATGPYLHDGRATSIEEAIVWHGGEAANSRDLYTALAPDQKADLLEFLLSLGGRDQRSGGLLPPDSVIASAGEYGGPQTDLEPADLTRFAEGQRVFDRDHGTSEGLGGPRLNGDSCRACHFEPVVGGAGPRGTNVMRHGILNAKDEFVSPQVGTTVLHKSTVLFDSGTFPQTNANIFEHRQSPSLLGVGLIDGIAEDTIKANADPNDLDSDGVSGRVSIVDGGRLGKFGWKAQVPSLAEFVRDAVTVELGMTLPLQEGLSFGKIHDNDDVADPEMSLTDAASLLFFMKHLGAPARQDTGNNAAVLRGQTGFDSVGCTKCHVPVLEGSEGPVALYSDLLLHEILPPGKAGIEEGSANMREFRTPPLWGIASTAPYLHTGAADTLVEAINGHDGEALAIREAFAALSESARADILAFLGSL